MKDCVFCSIIQKGDRLGHEVIWQNKNYIVFLDLYPTKNGHILVVPKKHTEYVFDLTRNEYLKLLDLARSISIQLKKHTKAKRIYLFIKGSQVPHVHVHLIPIHKHKEAGSLPRKNTTKEELHRVANHLRKFLKL